MKKAVSSIYLIDLIDFLESSGFDVNTLCKTLNISRKNLGKPFYYVNAEQFSGVANTALSLKPRQKLVTYFVGRTEITKHGLVGLLVLCGTTLQTALKSFLRFYPLQTRLLDITFSQGKEYSTLYLKPHSGLDCEVAKFLAETALFNILKVRTQLISDSKYSEKLFIYGNTIEDQEIANYYTQFFRIPVCLSDQTYQIEFSTEDLSKKLKSAHAASFDLLSQKAEESLNLIKEPVDLKDKISIILKQSEGKLPSREEMARLCHVSARTLGRHLEKAGLSYQQLYDQERIRRAKKLLDYGTMNITDIAHTLYFSDNSYFTKVFKTYTTLTPTQYKEKQSKSA